jgi:hypothetical protein
MTVDRPRPFVNCNGGCETAAATRLIAQLTALCSGPAEPLVSKPSAAWLSSLAPTRPTLRP